jgi:hypothetical protein
LTEVPDTISGLKALITLDLSINPLGKPKTKPTFTSSSSIFFFFSIFSFGFFVSRR